MKKKLFVLSTGFDLFSMFFGSGNLVYPFVAGHASQGHYLLASFGFLLTGVMVPFLGVIGMMFYQGSIDDFFSVFGKKGTFLFSFFALALMGPFGVLARCLTVAHVALLQIVPSAPLALTSFVMCAVIFLLTVNKSKIVTIVGTFLTPFLLIALSAIVYRGFFDGHLPKSLSNNGFDALKNGFFQGNQTMDLLAAFFFSQFIYHYLRKILPPNNERLFLKVFYQSATIGASLLATVACSLVFLGSIYSELIAHTPPQEMFGTIAMATIGRLATPLLSVAVIFSCLTTSIVLTSLFAEFLQFKVTNGKLGMTRSLLITLSLGFFVSTLEFNGIASFVGPILNTIYPALIVLTVFNIFCKLYPLRATHWPFTLTIVAKLCIL